MADNDIPKINRSAPPDDQQDQRERFSIQAPVDEAAYLEITRAFKRLGRLNTSYAASLRIICLAYARSEEVQEAVRHALALVVLDRSADEAPVVAEGGR